MLPRDAVATLAACASYGRRTGAAIRELFDITELVQIAVQDEASGVAFYSQLALQARGGNLRELFAQLSREEQYHQHRFSELLDALGGRRRQKEEYPGEYVEYLRTLTGLRAFPDEMTASKLAAGCKGDVEALDLATRFERDTLILMNEMRAVLPEADRGIIDEIAREERAHLVALGQARTLVNT